MMCHTISFFFLTGCHIIKKKEKKKLKLFVICVQLLVFIEKKSVTSKNHFLICLTNIFTQNYAQILFLISIHLTI